MAYEWAKPGVKVVCVDGTPHKGYAHDIWPITDNVYTIREIFWFEFRGEVHMRLVEVVNTPKKYRDLEGLHEASFRIGRFRPLVTKKLPDTLTILLEKPNRLIVPDGFDNLRIKTKEKVSR